MKTLAFIVLAALSYSAFAQKSLFVRIYDLKGNKILSSYVATVTDSSLVLERAAEPLIIAVKQIGSIKTKRPGNNIIVGFLIGAASLAIGGVVSSEPNTLFGYSPAEGAALGALVGLPIGAAAGALTIPFKNSKTYVIDGDYNKWKMYSSALINVKNKAK